MCGSGPRTIAETRLAEAVRRIGEQLQRGWTQTSLTGGKQPGSWCPSDQRQPATVDDAGLAGLHHGNAPQSHGHVRRRPLQLALIERPTGRWREQRHARRIYGRGERGPSVTARDTPLFQCEAEGLQRVEDPRLRGASGDIKPCGRLSCGESIVVELDDDAAVNL